MGKEVSLVRTKEEDSKKQTYKSMVVQSNTMVTNVQKKLSTVMAKLLFYLASKIDRVNTDIPIIIADIRELCYVIGFDPAYRQNRLRVKTMLSEMANIKNASFSIKSDSGWAMPLPWVENVFYKSESHLVAVVLNRRLTPYFVSLKSNFTIFDVSITSRLDSKFSINLYEFAKSNQFKGNLSVDIEHYKDLYGIDGKAYERGSNLMMRVIEPAVKEINEKTDIEITVTPQKDGRRYVSLDISIKEKSKSEREVVESISTKWNGALTAYRPSAEEERREKENVHRLLYGDVETDDSLEIAPWDLNSCEPI